MQSLHIRAQVVNSAFGSGEPGAQVLRLPPPVSVRPPLPLNSATRRLPTSIVSTSPEPVLASSLTTHSMTALPCRRKRAIFPTRRQSDRDFSAPDARSSSVMALATPPVDGAPPSQSFRIPVLSLTKHGVPLMHSDEYRERGNAAATTVKKWMYEELSRIDSSVCDTV
jgi:hypothetical protein